MPVRRKFFPTLPPRPSKGLSLPKLPRFCRRFSSVHVPPKQRKNGKAIELTFHYSSIVSKNFFTIWAEEAGAVRDVCVRAEEAEEAVRADDDVCVRSGAAEEAVRNVCVYEAEAVAADTGDRRKVLELLARPTRLQIRVRLLAPRSSARSLRRSRLPELPNPSSKIFSS